MILRDRSHPEQGFRSCLGIMRLAKPHGPEALEAACERALTIGARSYSSVSSILKNNLHRNRPETMHDELTEDCRDVIYAETAAEVETRRKAFERKCRLKCRAVADSLEEAGERLSSSPA